MGLAVPESRGEESETGWTRMMSAVQGQMIVPCLDPQMVIYSRFSSKLWPLRDQPKLLTSSTPRYA